MEVKFNVPKKLTIESILFIIIAVVAFSMWWFLGRDIPLSEGLIQANGRIEGDHYTVASKMPGQVAELHHREGEAVDKDQILLRLDDRQMTAKVKQASFAVQALEANLKAEQTIITILKKEIPNIIATAEAGEAVAQAQLDTAIASGKKAERDAKRFQNLAKKGTVDQNRYEQAQLAWEVAKSQTISAQKMLERAEKQIIQAKLGGEKIQAKEEGVLAVAAQLGQAKAALSEAQSALDDLTIRAPASGIITTRTAEVGEVVGPGMPLFEIVNLDRLYLKVYIPGKVIGKVRRGLSARIYTDAFPDEAFPAKLRYIASRAEFTPKEVQTPDERVKLVYAVKLYLDENPNHLLTPGLPADAIIRWKEETPWEKPRW